MTFVEEEPVQKLLENRYHEVGPGKVQALCINTPILIEVW